MGNISVIPKQNLRRKTMIQMIQIQILKLNFILKRYLALT